VKPGWLALGPDGPGAVQMEIDRRMAAATAWDGRTRIRLYRFLPPAVSLGYHQREGDIDRAACRGRGFDIVRRPTGGRAVLHKGDLVYSITVAEKGLEEDAPLHRGVYNLVSLALVQGLRRLGVQADPAADPALLAAPKGDLPRLCFSSATRHEVQVRGKKLVGSAQRRLRGVVLQHGSILAGEDHLEIVDVLSGVTSERRGALRDALHKRTICLHEAGYRGSLEEIREILAEAFEEVFAPLERRETESLDGLVV